jgi:serine/threonine protein kinase
MVKRKTSKETYAAKIFDKALIENDEMEKVRRHLGTSNNGREQKCLLNEIKILRMVRNKGCMQLYETYEGNQFVYLVTTLFEGTPLIQEILSKNRFCEVDSIIMIKSLLKSLAYLHSINILHRDVKPENLIYLSDKKNKLGLIDFGFATLQDEYDFLFTRCGTPGYVAPEVLDDQPYDTKADVFSAGVTLYIL